MQYIYKKYNGLIRRIRLRFWKKYRINQTLSKSVICNNCVGAMVLHDFGLKFCSPFVNLFIEPESYIEMLENLDFYLNPSADLIDITGSSNYPIGLLQGKITIHFLHYKSFGQAKKKWFERLKRMNREDIYVIFVKQEKCTTEHILKFDKMKFSHKLLLSNIDEPCDTNVIIQGFEDKDELGVITDYKSYDGSRYYDFVDWKNFLNLNA